MVTRMSPYRVKKLVFLGWVSYTNQSTRVIKIEEGAMDIGPSQSNLKPTTHPVVAPSVPPAAHRVNPLPSAPRKRPQRKQLAVGTMVVLLVLVGMFWSWWLFGRNAIFNENTNVNPNEYQAIFLTNGQVYFGKLADLNHKYVTITDVYYLQVQQNSSLQGASSSTSPNSQVSLVKLGSELHGPQDEMYIASNQMLFWENLKSGGKVVQAINRYQEQR